MTTSTNHSPEPSPWERQFNAVVEGVARSLTHFSNVFDRMRRHHREDHRESLENINELKAMIVESKIDLKKELQDVLHESMRTRAALVCWNDQEKD